MSLCYEPRWTPEEYKQKPTEYDPLLAEQIVERLANGDMLPVICKDRDMPLPATFLRWVELDPELEKAYIRARRFSAEINLDLMIVAAEGKNSAISGIQSRALLSYVEKTDPARYGPRALIRTKEGDEDGGIDYRDEVRRRIEAISGKLSQQARDAQE